MVAAANTTGGNPDHPSEEMKGFKVAFGELENVAKNASGRDGPSGELYWAMTHLSSLKLSPGAFGPSHHADAAVSGWNDSLDQRQHDIGKLINLIADMGDKLQLILDNYVRNEEKNEEAVKEGQDGAADKVNDTPREGYHENPKLLRPEGVGGQW